MDVVDSSYSDKSEGVVIKVQRLAGVIVLAVLVAACSSGPKEVNPVITPPKSEKPAVPDAQTPAKPEPLPVGNLVSLLPDSEWKAENGNPDRLVWRYKGEEWSCGADAFTWASGQRSLAALDPSSALPLTRQITVPGTKQNYPGLIVQGAEGTGAGSSGYWSLYTGGETGWVRVTCGGPFGAMSYEDAKAVVEPLLLSTKVTDLGNPLE